MQLKQYSSPHPEAAFSCLILNIYRKANEKGAWMLMSHPDNDRADRETFTQDADCFEKPNGCLACKQLVRGVRSSHSSCWRQH